MGDEEEGDGRSRATDSGPSAAGLERNTASQTPSPPPSSQMTNESGSQPSTGNGGSGSSNGLYFSESYQYAFDDTSFNSGRVLIPPLSSSPATEERRGYSQSAMPMLQGFEQAPSAVFGYPTQFPISPSHYFASLPSLPSPVANLSFPLSPGRVSAGSEGQNAGAAATYPNYQSAMGLPPFMGFYTNLSAFNGRQFAGFSSSSLPSSSGASSGSASILTNTMSRASTGLACSSSTSTSPPSSSPPSSISSSSSSSSTIPSSASIPAAGPTTECYDFATMAVQGLHDLSSLAGHHHHPQQAHDGAESRLRTSGDREARPCAVWNCQRSAQPGFQFCYEHISPPRPQVLHVVDPSGSAGVGAAGAGQLERQQHVSVPSSSSSSSVQGGASASLLLPPSAASSLSVSAPPATSQSSKPKKKKRASPQCSQPGCVRVAQRGGLCGRHGGSKLCSVSGCRNAAQSAGLCTKHGGGKRCSAKGCANAAKSSGLCARHGGGKLCSVKDCMTRAVARGLCVKHGGRKRCLVPDCHTSAVSRGLCVRHGGGKRCKVKDCTNGAQSGGFCIRHGGGKRCAHENCNNSAAFGGMCIRHGGGVRCEVPDCPKSAQGGMIHGRFLCARHGGGKRCSVPDCQRSAQSRDLCIQHGGGTRCAVTGCNRIAASRNLCKAHGGDSRKEVVDKLRVAGIDIEKVLNTGSGGGGRDDSAGGQKRKRPDSLTQHRLVQHQQRHQQGLEGRDSAVGAHLKTERLMAVGANALGLPPALPPPPPSVASAGQPGPSGENLKPDHLTLLHNQTEELFSINMGGSDFSLEEDM